MKDILTLAKERAIAYAVKNVVVGSNTGRSVLEARGAFGDGFNIIALGNPASSHERGLVHHSGMSEETICQLEDAGITVALHEQSIFQGMGTWFRGVSLDEIVENVGKDRQFGAIQIIYRTLQFFGNGPRVCLEIAMMAADTGLLPVDADCIAIARPGSWCNMPDAAMILRPAKTQDMFKGELRVKDLVLVPHDNDPWFTDKPVPW